MENDNGRNILITGSSSGIGFYALVNLLKKENHLFIPVRSFSRGQDLKLKLRNFFNDDYLNKFLNLIYDTDFSDFVTPKSRKVSIPDFNSETISSGISILVRKQCYQSCYFSKLWIAKLYEHLIL